MFMPEVGKRELPAIGSTKAKIAIIGDFTSGFDATQGRPFSGPGGSVIEQCLHAAGLIRGECYMTNLFKQKVMNPGKYFDDRKCTFTQDGWGWVERLGEELQATDANIFVACGAASFAALCNLNHLSMYRGYVFESTLMPGRKVIPTHHPMQAVRGMYTYRHMIAHDLHKAKGESQFPEIRRPDRQLTYRYNTVNEALEWLDFYANESIVGFDIEVLNYEVSCISLASTPEVACVIPLTSQWTLQEEVQIWRGIQAVLGNPNITKVIQNSMFDVPFLLTRAGIVTRGPIHDTMIGHSIMYSELTKGLGFLGSLYCGAQDYWKDTVKFKNIKDES